LDANPIPNWKLSGDMKRPEGQKRSFADEVKSYEMKTRNSDNNHEVGFIRSSELLKPRYGRNNEKAA